MPLLAGPGAISMVILYAHKNPGVSHYLAMSLDILIVGILLWAELKLVPWISRHVSQTGINIFTRIMGLMLMKIAKATHSTVMMVTHDAGEAVLLSNRIAMLTNGPAATIGEILSVDLARPRARLALAEDPHYHHLRGQVLEFLYHRQLRPAA